MLQIIDNQRVEYFYLRACNRTILELKLVFAASAKFGFPPCNRTILELKLRLPFSVCLLDISCNRTILELKP